MKAPPTTVEGVFDRRVVLAGTRSAHEAPVLIVRDDLGEEVVVRVHVVGDESFTEETLTGLIGKRATVGPGKWRNRVLRVTADQIAVVATTTSAETAPPETSEPTDATAATETPGRST